MRTTLNLPDALAEAAKRRAAEAGRTFTSLVEEGLRRVLEDDGGDRRAHSITVFRAPDGSRMIVDPADKLALTAVLDEDLDGP